jgi:hypothetical protein
MRRDETTTADDLDRPDGNGLVANYEKHDVGEAELIDRLDGLDCAVHNWGIDMREDGGEDGVIYDDKMDFKVTYEGELVAIIDVKTKSSNKWMGTFNKRHYTHYYGHAAEYDVPVFVVMFHLDYRSDTIHDEFTFEIGRDVKGKRVYESDKSDAVDRFPDRNEAVLVPHEHRRRWEYLEMRLEQQKTSISKDG